MVFEHPIFLYSNIGNIYSEFKYSHLDLNVFTQFFYLYVVILISLLLFGDYLSIYQQKCSRDALFDIILH